MQYNIQMEKEIKKENRINITIKFDGEYLNGKRNGKGKEYNEYGELIFEGEYLNDQRNGKGKEYDKSREFDLIFEGEYLNGERWNGKLKEFNKKDRFIKVIWAINNGRQHRIRKLIKELICDYFNKNTNMKGIENKHNIFLRAEYEYSCGNIIKQKIL